MHATSPLSKIVDEESLEELLSRPDAGVCETMRRLDGNLMLLGAGGKMGPTLARLARRALDEIGRTDRKVFAVSRFSDVAAAESLTATGVEVIRGDLLDTAARRQLPHAENVIYLAGHKFSPAEGDSDPSAYWMHNTHLAGLIAEQYAESRIVAFSTGNVYPFVDADGPMPTEDTPCAPVGEYAQSCLGRERIFQAFSRRNGSRVCLLRLNYAVELRYGVLVDLATSITRGEPIELGVPAVNQVWQGYANRVAIRALELAGAPAEILNVTGPGRHRVRELALRLGGLLGKEPQFTAVEGEQALLSDASRCHQLYGVPDVDVDALLEGVAAWVHREGRTLGKPTKYYVRDGTF